MRCIYLKWFLSKTIRNQHCESLIKHQICCEIAYICSEGRHSYGSNDGENNKPRIREISTVLMQKPMQIMPRQHKFTRRGGNSLLIPSPLSNRWDREIIGQMEVLSPPSEINHTLFIKWIPFSVWDSSEGILSFSCNTSFTSFVPIETLSCCTVSIYLFQEL